MTNTEAQTMTTLDAREGAMALDLLDEAPITRLTEDERDDAALNDLDEYDMFADWEPVDDYMTDEEMDYRMDERAAAEERWMAREDAGEGGWY